jgi:hypothetical protein
VRTAGTRSAENRSRRVVRRGEPSGAEARCSDRGGIGESAIPSPMSLVLVAKYGTALPIWEPFWPFFRALCAIHARDFVVDQRRFISEMLWQLGC